MDIVDTHLHLWDIGRFRYPWLDDPGAEGLRWNYLVEDWARDAAGAGVSTTVHVQAELDHALDPVLETAWLAELAAAGRPSTPTVCVGYADLRAPDLGDVLDRHCEFSLFRGIRQEAWFDPASRRADVPRFNLLDDPAWIGGLDELARRGLTFDLLVWSTQLEQAAGIFARKPGLQVVLEHAGVPVDRSAPGLEVWRRGLRAFAAAVPASVLKISALSFVSPSWSLAEVGPIVREALEIFGPERCVLGSNFPVDRPAIGYRELWAAYAEFTADLTDTERTALFAGTARRIYRIEPATAGLTVEKGREGRT
ncbi:amidohydrolase [Actinomadura sp. WMMA1423]|uniref:amidohydrolase family protein n=1 Tax=Actinomadura sp. WMMA1423 TaxID=2591108 RepID=UPI001146E021|nr:amidohydrolase family protein [Actinomadura sp. WMMA1423]